MITEREHLPAAGPQRPQESHLAGPLRHDDVERVEDDEGADEQRDEGEHEQRRAQEPQAFPNLIRLLGGGVGRRDRLEAGGEHLLDLRGDRCRRRIVRRDDVDLVEGTLAVEEALRGSKLERRDGVAADRRRGRQRDDAGESVRIDTERCDDPDLVTDIQTRFLDGVRVDHDLVLALRRLPRELERRDVRVPRASDRRRAAARDHLVGLRVDHLRESAHAAVRRGHTGQRLDISQDLLRDRVPLLTSSPTTAGGDVLERVLRLHDDVGLREDVAEEIVERGQRGVGEHERSRDEPDPEHDCHRRQDEPELPREHALQRGSPHLSVPSPSNAPHASSNFIRSRTRSAVGSRISSTTWPSARNTIRFA